MAIIKQKSVKEVCGFCNSKITQLKDLCYLDKTICCSKCCSTKKNRILNETQIKKEKFGESKWD